MISYTLGTNIYGEPYNTSGSLAGCPGYTGKYTLVFLLSLGVFYSLWIGVQLPQGIYISYGRGYIMVSIGCNIGYTPGSSVSILFPLYEFHLTPAVHAPRTLGSSLGTSGVFFHVCMFPPYKLPLSYKYRFPLEHGYYTGVPNLYPTMYRYTSRFTLYSRYIYSLLQCHTYLSGSILWIRVQVITFQWSFYGIPHGIYTCIQGSILWVLYICI